MNRPTSNPNVLLGVSGSIAAYKAAEIARLLVKRQWNVEVLMTSSALRFVGAETFSGITGNPVHTEMWGHGGELHVQLAAKAEVYLIAPGTADVMARLANGRSDDLLTATALCCNAPVYIAPAMHPNMWQHAATQRNVEQLRHAGIQLLGPAHGQVASGDVGYGRLLDPSAIVEAIEPRRDLEGKRIVVSAGPTIEDIDPVRFIGNRSSGKMGFALAERAAARGAAVTLVTGPVSLATPRAVERVDVRSAEQMLQALRQCLAQPTDAVIMAAAVGDYRPATQSESKLKRGVGGVHLELTENPDIIRTLASANYDHRPTFIAFAVETGADEEVLSYARGKLDKKNVDAVVANRADEAFGGDGNRAHLVTRNNERSLPTMSKTRLADAILDWLIQGSEEGA